MHRVSMGVIQKCKHPVMWIQYGNSDFIHYKYASLIFALIVGGGLLNAE